MLKPLVSTPYASGLSTLVTDESELGAACIDMGGGTTSLSVFANRQIVHLGRNSNWWKPRHQRYRTRVINSN